MADPAEIERLVQKFGEPKRQAIVAALRFLDQQEPTWGLDQPIDREGYIAEVMCRSKEPTNG